MLKLKKNKCYISYHFQMRSAGLYVGNKVLSMNK